MDHLLSAQFGQRDGSHGPFEVTDHSAVTDSCLLQTGTDEGASCASAGTVDKPRTPQEPLSRSIGISTNSLSATEERRDLRGTISLEGERPRYPRSLILAGKLEPLKWSDGWRSNQEEDLAVQQ